MGVENYLPPVLDGVDMQTVASLQFRSQESCMTINSFDFAMDVFHHEQRQQDDYSARSFHQAQPPAALSFPSSEGLVDSAQTSGSIEWFETASVKTYSDASSDNNIDPNIPNVPEDIAFSYYSEEMDDEFLPSSEEMEMGGFKPLFTDLDKDSVLSAPKPRPVALPLVPQPPVALPVTTSLTQPKGKRKAHTAEPSLIKRKVKRERKDYDPPLEMRVYFPLTDLDVGMGRGGGMNRHKGNLRFHQAKLELQPAYLEASKTDCTAIAQQLVGTVKAWGGRFLKKDDIGHYEVHDHTARIKASQALREHYTAEENAKKRKRHRENKRQKQQQQQQLKEEK